MRLKILSIINLVNIFLDNSNNTKFLKNFRTYVYSRFIKPYNSTIDHDEPDIKNTCGKCYSGVQGVKYCLQDA